MFIRKPLYLMAERDGAGDGAGAGGEGGSGEGGAAGATAGGDNGGKPAEEGKTFTQADVDRIIAGRLQKYADYDDLKTQLAELQQANQTEQEKAVNGAREEGRKEALLEAGKSLALEVFNGAAARRNADYDTAPALELLDLGRFVKEDGALDRDAIADAVERIVPEKEPAKPAPSFGGGARKTAGKPDPGPGVARLRAAYAETK